MLEPKVGIVLVNFNGEKFQNECLRTLKNMNYKNYLIIIIDNGSTDNSISNLKNDFPDVILLEMNQNIGVAKGNNVGIIYALENNCEYVLLLNNDTEVEQNLLKNLIVKATPKTLVIPKMYYYDPKDMIWCAGGEINWNRATTIHYGMKEKDNGQYKREMYVEYAPTCCMLIHKTVFGKIGLMDEKYFMYYDDTDFCTRVINGGYKILYTPDSVLWHKVSSSSGGESSLTSIYYGNRNRLYYIDKFYTNKLKVKSFYYITRFLKVFNWIMTGNRQKVSILIKAIRDYRNSRMGISA